MIVVTLPCLLIGGTELQTLQLVKVLKEFNQKVVLCVYFEAELDMIKRFEMEGVIVKCLHLKRNISSFKFIYKMVNFFMEIKPKIVHVQYMAPGALPIIAAVFARVPRIIANVHQPYTISHGWKSKLILRFAAYFCNPFLSVSQNAARSWFGKATLIDAKKPIDQQPSQLTLYNSINVQHLQTIAKQFHNRNDLRLLNIYPETYVIGAVSRLRIEKGIDLLITSFAQLLSKSDRDLRLLLVGDGADRNQLEELAVKLNCYKNIVFYGAAEWEEAMQLMARMDLVVVPSRFEGFGLAAAEAMAMSKPLICSNTFGLLELVSHGKEGLLFENEDTKVLYSHLYYLMHHPKKAEYFGTKALSKVMNNFDYPIYLKSIKTLYKL